MKSSDPPAKRLSGGVRSRLARGGRSMAAEGPQRSDCQQHHGGGLHAENDEGCSGRFRNPRDREIRHQRELTGDEELPQMACVPRRPDARRRAGRRTKRSSRVHQRTSPRAGTPSDAAAEPGRSSVCRSPGRCRSTAALLVLGGLLSRSERSTGSSPLASSRSSLAARHRRSRAVSAAIMAPPPPSATARTSATHR